MSMNVYRDYGSLDDKSPPNNLFTLVNHTLVWYATHDGGGASLPYRQRSFISFSFGGKLIEEFNLIAYCEGNTMNRKGSADFEDLVSSYDIMDGLYYHGTHYKPNTLSLNLVSDGIDLLELDNFLNWFLGGKTRELVLAEHPNRAIMARVASAPQLNLLPFEKVIEQKIVNFVYTTSTTVYKGTILLELVSDTPFWYAKLNLLLYNSDDNVGIFKGIKLDNTVPEFKEAVKIVYEDGVPFNTMLAATTHVGMNSYAKLDSTAKYTSICAQYNNVNPTELPSEWSNLVLLPGYFIMKSWPVYDSVYNIIGTIEALTFAKALFALGVVYGDGYSIVQNEAVNLYWTGAKVEQSGNIIGRIAGPVMVEENTNLSGPIIEDSDTYLFFYGGTAPSPATISFKINLLPTELDGDNADSHYINCIGWEHYHSHRKPYNTITIKSIHTKEFKFTTPNVITSYNKVIRILVVDVLKRNRYTNWKDLMEALRDLIRHPAVRKWAIDLYKYLYKEHKDETSWFSSEGVINILNESSTFITNFLLKFPRFFCRNENEWPYAEFEFDAEKGVATGTFTYLSGKDNLDWASYIYSNSVSSSNIDWSVHIEDVGDMLCSNWIIIEDRNLIGADGYVNSWSAKHPENAHILSHNCRVPLKDLKIKYKNMYL